MSKKIAVVLVKLLLACSTVLSVWLAVSNMLYINDEHFLVPLSILVIICLFIFVPDSLIKNVAHFFKQRPNMIKLCAIIIILFSLAARFTFLSLEYQPKSDPGSFFTAAQNIANDNSLGNKSKYVAIFPYLFAYDAILGGVMKVFGTGLLSVIILNTLLDMIAVILLYILVKKISKNNRTAKIAAFLWLVSPFNIIFSAISLPIIAVNTCIIASILLVYLVISYIDKPKKFIPLSVLAGTVFALSNAFRPIMIVFVLATIIYFALVLLRRPTIKLARNMFISLAFLLVPFFTLNVGYVHLVSAATNYPPTLNSGGWSIFVGANYRTWGRWNTENGYFDQVLSQEPTITDAQNRMQREGVERYKTLSPIQLVDFMIKNPLS